MAGRLSSLLDQWRLRKAQARWSRAADAAPGLDPATLRSLRSEARVLRRQIDRVLHVAEYRLSAPSLSAPLPRQPLGTDWTWRPDVWRGPLPRPGVIAATDRTEVSEDLTLYHDCPLGEIALRQRRNVDPGDRAPFGLSVDVFGFRGSFLSLSIRLPDDEARTLRTRHVLRVDGLIGTERPLEGFARLNIRHGPNVAQMVSALPSDRREATADFDLAYSGVDDSRIDRAWLDLIFNEASLNRIRLTDITVSRRPRAEL